MEKIFENYKQESKSTEAMECVEMNDPEDESNSDSPFGFTSVNSADFMTVHHMKSGKLLKNNGNNVVQSFPYDACGEPVLRSKGGRKSLRSGLKRLKHPEDEFFDDLEHVTEALKKRRIDSHSTRCIFVKNKKLEHDGILEVPPSETHENSKEGDTKTFLMDMNSVEPSSIVDTNTVELNKSLRNGTILGDKCWVKVKFPNGKMIRNVFHSSEPLSAVQLWATLNNPSGCITPVALVRTFPSKIFTDHEMHLSLTSLNLTPSCTLMTRSLSFNFRCA